MAQNRPEKPLITLPDDFGGTQTAFDDSLVENGYEPSIPQILEGGNLNYMLNGLFQNTKYMRAVLDYVRDTPVGKMFWVNPSGQMDYIQPAVIATDVEFTTGTATDKTPNVKQVVDKLAIKANITDMQAYVGTVINTLLGNLYPVGSIYASTNATCPLAGLISGSEWSIVATKIVTDVSGTVGIKGTGKTLGLTNGSANVGLSADNDYDRNSRVFTTGAYNRNVSSSYSSTNQNSGCFGVVTNASTSGLTGVATSTTLTLNIWKRTR